ncbi:MAG: TatD family hydrolase [Candidatus Methanosuratincola petrocarbonis]|nr:TatD family hydrolase [Candidatus Methanosuratincola sp.]
MLILIDAHAHLTDPAFSDLPEVIRRAKAAGIAAVVTSITDPADMPKAKEIVGRYSGYVYLTVGLDPTLLSEEKLSAFRVALNAAPIVGVGEVGLDHFYVRDAPLMEIQERHFRECIRAAISMDKPLVIHSRSAGRKALEVLYSEGAERVLMHAFDGKSGDALAAAKKGYFFSIPTSVVHSEQKQKLVRLLPLESMMLETDSPVLSPVRGERNEPANLVHSARKVAEIKRIPIEKVVETTSANASSFYRITV